MTRRISIIVLLSGLLGLSPDAFSEALRVATFNVAMGLDRQGALAERLSTGEDPGLRAMAEVLQRVRPDIVLVNEFDYAAFTPAAQRLSKHYLARAQKPELEPIDYPYHYTAPVNTGVGSGLDLDGDGQLNGPGDAWGFGRFPGQYGMLLLSRWPIDTETVRTFQNFRWSQLPGSEPPAAPGEPAFYDDATWAALRLSSKSHWDIPVQTPAGTVHVLASHPTPPVFDGPEDRNGLRNRDEIRFWAEYIEPGQGAALVDDQGVAGGLPVDATWVMLGDLNADPLDGESPPGGIDRFMSADWVNHDCTPASAGGVDAAERQAGANARHRGDPAHDTADFDDRHAGNLRVDYVLTGSASRVRDCGVFWPAPGEPSHNIVEFSDHRLVWIDLEPAGYNPATDNRVTEP
ncbi:endonuclease/exonuclease/phosphatase family protein [Marinihelvus fidelis]|uniref:Endonuclease/exonuclease/phosphatase family protein n=1 Tax=Marinihelvus fidelis TaxID=2613842 RepID=A0A5N0TEI2_9GAMM|nr:endonuclease/exonuclease/phosphatase family protein [Marinihelvus fidelis]KAA9133081.1 endonuclease/exonuclease/phosphatase family protein [Marinihelvus fidelis]